MNSRTDVCAAEVYTEHSDKYIGEEGDQEALKYNMYLLVSVGAMQSISLRHQTIYASQIMQKPQNCVPLGASFLQFRLAAHASLQLLMSLRMLSCRLGDSENRATIVFSASSRRLIEHLTISVA